MTRVRFVVLNLRLGGQVSGVLAVCDELRRRGWDASLLLPAGLGSASKPELTAFGALPAPRRFAATLRLLASLRDVASGPDEVVHLVLPSPAFLPLLWRIPLPARRVVVAYEGPCTAFDREHLQALADDPWLLLPRMLLSNRAWMRLGPIGSYAHVAAHPLVAAQLRRAGACTVYEIANLAELTSADTGPALSPLPLREPGTIWCAYVGHAHPVKGVYDLVDAFAEASRRRPDLRLLLALSGDRDVGPLARRVGALGLVPHVSMLGLVDVRALLKQTDVLVLPYRSTITTTLYPSLLLEAAEAG